MEEESDESEGEGDKKGFGFFRKRAERYIGTKMRNRWTVLTRKEDEGELGEVIPRAEKLLEGILRPPRPS